MNARKQSQDITVHITKGFKDIDISLPGIRKLVRDICGRFGFLKGSVGIALLGNSEIRRINKRFLAHNRITDVVSFDLSDGDAEFAGMFEMVVNAEKAVKEAKLRGCSTEAELALYITHGLLHNFGFNDSQPKQAKKMHDTEDEILRQFGYGPVYNQRIISRPAKHKKSVLTKRPCITG